MEGDTQLPKKVKFGFRKILKVIAGPFLKPKEPKKKSPTSFKDSKEAQALSPGMIVQVRVATRWRARQVTATPLSSGRAGTATRSADGTGPARTPSGRPWNCREAAGTPPGQEQRKRRLRSAGPPSTEHCGAPGGRSATEETDHPASVLPSSPVPPLRGMPHSSYRFLSASFPR